LKTVADRGHFLVVLGGVLAHVPGALAERGHGFAGRQGDSLHASSIDSDAGARKARRAESAPSDSTSARSRQPQQGSARPAGARWTTITASPRGE
jgi:hypothetical protein